MLVRPVLDQTAKEKMFQRGDVMEMKLTKDKSKLVCCWSEPCQVRFQGRTVTMPRKITRRLRVNRSGSVPAKELIKLGAPERQHQVCAWMDRVWQG